MKRSAAAVALLASISVMIPSIAGAVGQDNLTLSPTSKSPSLAAGQSESDTLSLTNDGETAYDFKVYATPYNVDGEDYSQSFQLKPNETDVSRWFTINPATYHLQPHEHADIPYTLTIPQGAAAGGYYATVFAETQPGVASTSGVQTRKRVGSIFYITVAGAITQAGSVDSWSAPFWQNGSPLTATLKMKNTGNVHYKSTSTVTITDVFGNKKAEVATDRYVLPQSIRKIPFAWDKAPNFGLFKVSGTVVYLNKTETLPAHYVLLLPPLYFVIAVVALLIIFLLWRSSRKGATPTSTNKKTPAKKRRA